jgi:CheY-like chemotaxis protein
MTESCSAKRIVVIDDAGDSARLLSMLLKRLGYEVHVAVDGSSGVELVRQVQPQIVISDVLMSGEMDGYAVLVALTGRSGEEARLESLAAGFDEHLVKPVDVRRLEELIQTAEQNGRESR